MIEESYKLVNELQDAIKRLNFMRRRMLVEQALKCIPTPGIIVLGGKKNGK